MDVTLYLWLVVFFTSCWVGVINASGDIEDSSKIETKTFDNDTEINLCSKLHFEKEHEVFFCPPLHLIYLHIYKNGGTTVMNALKQLCDPYFIRDTYRTLPGIRENIRTSVEEIQSFRDTGSIVFVTVRDPIDRFLSAYHEVCRRKEFRLSPVTVKIVRFQNFLRYIKKLFTINRMLDPHLAPQTCFLKTLKNDSVPVDHIFLLETIETAIPDLVRKRHGILPENFTLETKRSRFDQSYGSEEFIILREMLEPWMVKTICALYLVDYQTFQLDRPPECINIEAEIDTIWEKDKLQASQLAKSLDERTFLKDRVSPDKGKQFGSHLGRKEFDEKGAHGDFSEKIRIADEDHKPAVTTRFSGRPDMAQHSKWTFTSPESNQPTRQPL